MPRIAIITDSSCGLSADLIARYDLHVLPYYLVAGGRRLRDGIQISRDEVFRLLRDGRYLPNTKAPTQEDYAACYRSLLGRVDAALVVLPPRERTAAYQHAESARLKTPELPIELLDSRHTATGQALVVLAAARAREAGGDLPGVLRAAQAAMERIELWVALPTLRFAARSGRVQHLGQRVSGADSIESPAGGLAHVLRHEHGALHIAFSAPDMDQAIRHMQAELADRVRGQPVRAAIAHAGEAARAESLRRWAQAQWSPAELHVLDLPPIIAVYSGPGAVGLAAYAE